MGAQRDRVDPLGPTAGKTRVDPDAFAARGETAPAGAAPPSGHDDADPARIGRFAILEKLGVGGMGVVYAAYDSELDRKIAIKLVRADSRDGFEERQRQLHREAQAMARLAHPNVVAIHEVGFHGKQIFVAMEFVVGHTLRGWLESAPRSWPEMQRVFIQAGRGLQAAHRAGMVHRDFKPENVLVGKDRRARVADFGLVYPIDGDASLAPLTATADTGRRAEAVALRAKRVTKQGRVVGTPAYMSPEQWLGIEITARSDQFSFCVALFEACHGELPFGGGTALEISGNVLAGELRTPMRTSRIPAWVHPVLARGLANDPKDRWPSMQELLAALASKPQRRLALIAAGLVGAITTGVLGYAAVVAAEREARACAGEDSIEAAWGEPQRRALKDAMLDRDDPEAAMLWRGVDERLDAYAREWVELRTESCDDHRRGVESDSLFDRRIRCLDERYDGFTAAVDVLVEGKANDGAVGLVTSLAPLALCADEVALEATVPPPSDPETAGRVMSLRRVLTEVRAYEKAGRYAEAQAVAAPVSGLLEGIDYPPLLAQALLRRGSLEMELGAIAEAERDLYESVWTALDVSDDATACEALGKWIFVVGARQGRTSDALSLERLALVLADRPENTDCSHTIFNNLGSVAHRSGDAIRARVFYLQALAAAERNRERAPLDYAATLNNLGLIEIGEARFAAALPFFTEAIEIYTATIGTRHLHLAYTLTNGAEAKLGAGDPKGARGDYLRALDIFSEVLGPTHPNLGFAYLGLAKAALAEGEPGLALRHLRFARELWASAEEPPGELSEVFALRARAELQEHDIFGAHASLRQVIRLRSAEGPLQDRYEAVDALVARVEVDGLHDDDHHVLENFLVATRSEECRGPDRDTPGEGTDPEQLITRVRAVLDRAK
ncbi:MAG: serine/threonine-protein kinase [Nannocystaceae bacterium]